MNGVIVVDKPLDWTSHDVVNRMRRIANTKKVGHLGTLDPQASGVLPLLIDRATRLAQYYTANSKQYEGTIRFGWATNTYDAAGEPAGEKTEVTVTAEMAARAFAPFRGTFMQTPPAVSAKKIDGRPAHELARKNIPFEMKPVEVRVDSLEILSVEGAEVRVRIDCGPGTYVRSIAHDAGVLLGCGAHLCALRRTASGSFNIGQARTLDELAALASEGRLADALIPASELLPEYPCERVDRITETHIRQGRDFRVSPFRDRGDAPYVKAISEDGELIALGEPKLPNVYHPVVVL